MCYFCVENVSSNLCELIDGGSHTPKNTQHTQWAESQSTCIGVLKENLAKKGMPSYTCVIFSGCFGTYYEVP